MDLKRILIDSNSPHEPTGYGRQTKYMCRIFEELGYEVGVVALHGIEGGSINWQGIPIFGKRTSHYCLDEMRHYVSYFNADVVITLYDLWHFPNHTAQLIGVPWIAMVPIEGHPIGGHLARLLRSAAYVVTYSQFGHDQLIESGVPNTCIPHCVDTAVYKPGDKRAFREEMGLDPDAYIATIVAMNKGVPPYRKAWPQLLRAWAEFSERHPTAKLYCHTNREPISPRADSGFRFDPLVEELGIDWSTLVFPEAEAFTVGVPDEVIAQIYAASDVTILPSMAEGFGLPVIETQACGTPILAHDCSAMTELVHNGRLIKRGEPVWIPERTYWWYRPEVEDILGALEWHHTFADADDLENMSRVGIEAMETTYSVEAVTVLWDQFLRLVGGELW